MPAAPDRLSLKKRELEELLTEKRRRKKYQQFKEFMPWPKQMLALDAQSRVIAVFGGNRTGKTHLGAFWTAAHLTGVYPEWWKGVRHLDAVDWWAAGVTLQSTRDIIQAKLLGDAKMDLGSGMIPKDLIEDIRYMKGAPDVVETIYVKHVPSGNISSCGMKSMEQGRGKFQGTARHGIWLDEEPLREDGYDIFSEAKLRTMTLPGAQILLTYTPLKGMNELAQYLIKTDDPSITRVVITWDDAPHLDLATRQEMERTMLPHEIEARRSGEPVVRDGLIWPFPMSQITCEPFPVPDHWLHVAGMDIGMDTPTTAILWAVDPKTGMKYVINEYAQRMADRGEHVRALKAWGEGLVFAVDPSANRIEGDGRRTMRVLHDLGLNVENANNDRQDSIFGIFEGFRDGTIKIFKTCTGLLDEMRFYQYENGRVKKIRDHRIDGFRYGFMALDQARPLAYFKVQWANKNRGVSHAHDVYRPGDSVIGY